jgi:hypothetical protein
VDGTAVKRKPAFDHCGGMEQKRDEQQEIIDAIILTEAFSPQENRVNHADSVEKHGESE